ncbi:MAG TPA: AMP-binding protein [Longimicrobium sp.]|nr:AMP-binding protein [Longimicrobium sp.]
MTEAFYGRVQEHARRNPEGAALSYRLPGGGYRVEAWAGLAGRARRLARYFADAGGDAAVVPMLVGKAPDAVAAMLGAQGAGRAFAALNPKFRLPQLVAALQATGSPVAVVDGPGLRVLAAGTDEPLVRSTRWLVVDPDASPLAKADGERLRGAGVALEDAAELPDVTDGWAPPAGADPARPGCCLFTSGSTGTPKGVLVSLGDLLGRAEAEREWFGLTAEDVLLNVLPFSFDVGLSQLLSALYLGCELVVSPSWLPRDLMEAARERGATGMCGVPSIWQDLLRTGAAAPPPPSLRYVTVSGGSLAPAQLAALAAALPGVGIYKTYGQTEAFRCASLRPEELAARPGSVGRAYPGVRLLVVDEEGRPCAPGETGEVVHAGLGTMLDYLGGGGEGKLGTHPAVPGLPVVYTGDLGWLDADGYLYLAGRRDGMVKVSGNRVFPAEVANHAAALPGVAEAQAVALPGAGDAALACFVVLHPGAEPDPAGLRRALAQRLPSYMVPRDVVVLDEMPRTPSGKPDLQELARRAAAPEPLPLAGAQT